MTEGIYQASGPNQMAGEAHSTSDKDSLDPVYVVAPSPEFAKDGICFAARLSGLYRSSDGGVTWTSAYRSLGLPGSLATPAVALSPAFPKDHVVWAGVQGAVLRSSGEKAQSWEVFALPSPPPMVSALVVSPNYEQDGQLFVGTLEDGVIRSADRGHHWHAWNFGLLDMHVLALAISPAFAEDETLVTGTETGLYRSTNGGRAWRETSFPSDAAPVLSLAFSPSFQQDNTLYAGTDEAGLFRSTDGGRTWSHLAADVLHGPIDALLVTRDLPADPHLLVVHGGRLLWSLDGGQTWSPWPAMATLDGDATTAAAPEGLLPGATLLTGLTTGRVVRL